MSITDASGPIEVWLSQRNMEVTCRVVYGDESTDDTIELDSLSMRGAQREITGCLKARGYEPVGRWDSELDVLPSSDYQESSRKFRPARDRAAAS
jgi:hypothetical protein